MYKIKAVNNDVETCEHCGKTNLKKVVWLSEIDADGTECGTIAVGTTCAARLTGFNAKTTDANTFANRYNAAQEANDKKVKAIEYAEKEALESGEEILVMRDGSRYYTVRARAFDANPKRYKGSFIKEISA